MVLQPARGPPPIQQLAQGPGNLGAAQGGTISAEGLDEVELFDRERAAAKGQGVGDLPLWHARPPVISIVAYGRSAGLSSRKYPAMKKTFRPALGLLPPETEGLR